MEITPKIYTAKVMHKRNFPKINQFVYNVYYLALPLSKLKSSITTKELAINKFGLISFHEKDHNNSNGSNEKWIKEILKSHKLDKIVKEIFLVSMPRIFGYVFNPVSFWLCVDKDTKLRAVLCEVNNTFGEAHSYFCYNADFKEISSEQLLQAKKTFHVSPFLQREGKYKFRFIFNNEKLAIWIDYYNENGDKQLLTSLIGKLEPLNKRNLLKVFLKHPLVTLKTIFLIHWQALKLILKGIKYIKKPKQLDTKISDSKD